MAYLSKTEERKSILNVKRACIAATVSTVFTIVLMLIISFLVNVSVFGEGAVPVFSVILTVAGAFFAGFLTALSVPHYGLFNGILSGISYFVIMFIFSSVISLKFAINGKFLTNLIICFTGGGAGGIVSINLRANRKNKRRKR